MIKSCPNCGGLFATEWGEMYAGTPCNCGYAQTIKLSNGDLIAERSQLLQRITELEAKCVQKDEALKNLVGHFTREDIGHFRSKHKGSSAGEMCCGDVVKAVESLSPTCGDSLLRDKERIKGYEKASTVLATLIEDARSKTEPYAKRENRTLDWWKGHFEGLVVAESLSAYGQFPEHNKESIDAVIANTKQEK